MQCAERPFKHLVIDGWHPSRIEWPRADHPNWVSYDSLLERKRALNDLQAMPPSCQVALFNLAALPAGRLLDITANRTPDCSWHGAGCHEMGPAGFLSLHLDSDRHPRLRLERRINAILFVSDWEARWGGELEFWQPGERKASVRVQPVRGRLVLFEVGDSSFHRVALCRCPEGAARRTLSCSWWGRPSGEGQRPRALFLPVPGEPADLEKDRLRRERSRFDPANAGG